VVVGVLLVAGALWWLVPGGAWSAPLHAYSADVSELPKRKRQADTVFIVKRGTATVTTKEGGKVAEVGEGKVFGELVLVGKKTKRNATVVASSEELVLLELSGDAVAANGALNEWREQLERAGITHHLELWNVECAVECAVALTVACVRCYAMRSDGRASGAEECQQVGCEGEA
jgi:hypothetical protein